MERMSLIKFDYLTEIEKNQVRKVFGGWDKKYLESLEFKKMDDGWIVRDEDLRARQYMHYENKKQNEEE